MLLSRTGTMLQIAAQHRQCLLLIMSMALRFCYFVRFFFLVCVLPHLRNGEKHPLSLSQAAMLIKTFNLLGLSINPSKQNLPSHAFLVVNKFENLSKGEGAPDISEGYCHWPVVQWTRSISLVMVK